MKTHPKKSVHPSANPAATPDVPDWFEHAPCGCHAVDKNGVLTSMNATELAWLGYSREELNHLKWQEITFPQDVELTQKMIDVLLSGEKESSPGHRDAYRVRLGLMLRGVHSPSTICRTHSPSLRL